MEIKLTVPCRCGGVLSLTDEGEWECGSCFNTTPEVQEVVNLQIDWRFSEGLDL
jgi:hypothetical protein